MWDGAPPPPLGVHYTAAPAPGLGPPGHRCGICVFRETGLAPAAAAPAAKRFAHGARLPAGRSRVFDAHGVYLQRSGTRRFAAAARRGLPDSAADVLRLSYSEATFGAFSTGDPWREEPRKRRREEEVYGMRPGMGMDDFGGKGWGKGMPPPIRQYSEPFSSPEFGRGKGGFKGPCAVVDSVD